MKDVLFGDFLITIKGNHQVIIENYKGIYTYHEDNICIHGNGMTLEICGKNLKIQYYSYEAMKVTGTIEKLEYIGV